MTKQLLKNFALVIIALTLVTNFAFSQGRNGRGGNKSGCGKGQNSEIFESLKTEMQKFHDEEIKPQMLKWQEEFMAELSSSEKAKVKEVKARTEKIKQAMKEKREAHQKARSERKRGEMEENRQAMKAHREEMQKFQEQMQALSSELEPIISAHREKLSEISKKADIKIKEWREKGEQIRDKWFEENKEELEKCKGTKGKGNRKFNKSGMGFGKGHGMMMRGFDLDGTKAACRFLLWDGEAPALGRSQG